MAAALFALPLLVLAVLETGAAVWSAVLAADLAVLGLHAWRTSSPLVVLAAGILVAVGGAVFLVIVTAGETCGGDTAAGIVEWTGAGAIGLGLGAWGVLHGLRILWVPPLALVCAAGWIVLAAHLVPGGAGPCLN